MALKDQTCSTLLHRKIPSVKEKEQEKKKEKFH